MFYFYLQHYNNDIKKWSYINIRQKQTMVNYENSKIYKLVNNVDDKIYIGSTCNTLRQRKYGHNQKSIKYPNRHVYQHLNQIGWGNVDIILIENYECKTKDELHARERHWIDELKPELNKSLPTQTKDEYTNKKKEDGTIMKRSKEYYDKNKTEILRKQLVKNTCECGKQYTQNHKKRHEKSKKHIDFINSQE